MNSLYTASGRHRHILSLTTLLLLQTSTSTTCNPLIKFLSTQSKLPIPVFPLPNCTPPNTNPQEKHLPPPQPPFQNPNKIPDFNPTELTIISKILTDPAIPSGPALEEALTEARINPAEALLLEIFKQFDFSPKLLFTLFLWAEKQPGYCFSLTVFNAIVNALGKAREFESAWSLILDRINKNASEMPDLDTFAIMIRRYGREGLPLPAIRTFEYASSLGFLNDLESGNNLLEILLDSLCKEGHVRVASEYFDKRRGQDPSWVPSIRIYNILLNGWFRSRKLKRAERLWVQMKKENVKPTAVTYGTLVEGLCRMRRPEMAMELTDEMRRERVEANAIVYNPIIDALGEAGRFQEALGMLERFSVLESGPTISTYNSLVKGFCKAGDIEGAGKILKMMINNRCLPTPTTYNYFFRYFSKFGKIEEGLNLYTKMIRSGYEPDRLTYHLLVRMLCERERLDLTTRVIREMRGRGFDLDLATGTMLIHLLCKMHRYDEAFGEFEDMIRRGIVPQYLTYQRMIDELKKQGMTERAQKLYDMMASVRHSTKLPDTYKGVGDSSRGRKASIIQKAEAISNILKTCKNPRELVKRRNPLENAVSSACQLMDNIKRKNDLT
ncbi:Pentatricopeptide repeat-containing protein [Forsythia ovata]|uniref:Pentatricopeptide repeat-containing protein n=1 Tax=Forsythia ovata TaxID=205694 RepID=A0ABD1W7B3_9LAMI